MGGDLKIVRLGYLLLIRIPDVDILGRYRVAEKQPVSRSRTSMQSRTSKVSSSCQKVSGSCQRLAVHGEG